MGKGAKGINLTFIFILVLVLVLVWASTNSGSSGSYTKGQFIADMEAGLVVDVEIHPNVQVPTGMLRITLKDGDQRNLYVSDVVEMQEVVTSYREANWIFVRIMRYCSATGEEGFVNVIKLTAGGCGIYV